MLVRQTLLTLIVALSAPLMALAEDRRAANAPLALLTYWLAHHRARLRAGG